MSRLTLSLLGQPRIECDGAPIVVDTRKAIALLAYVAVTHQHHSRDTLAVLLWPEYDHVRAYANLRRTIWALNKALAGDYLNIDRDTIGLNPQADLWIDVDHFTMLLARCRSHGHPETEVCSACLEALTEAAEIYRADFLHGFTLTDSPGFDDWQFFQAESLERSFAQALERLEEGYSAQGEFATAIVYARRWLALDALHEPAHRALMQLYAWSGQRSAALRQYRECTRVLHESLGAVPQAATIELYEAIKILATSIERLNLHEEWALEIQGLRYPEDDRAQDVERYSAVQFFIQSARRAYAGFVPADADRPQIVRICQLVAGMPVGIELAASWLRVLACREIVREVENNLDFLATSLRDVPDRHRSLRAVFEHSWDLLSAQEQHILSQLAVFRGGFRREAAERVAGAGLPLLLDLVNKSLLRRNAAGRYEMLEVIRQYAEERLDAESRRVAQEQHSLYYADLLRLYSQDIKGGRQQEALADTRQELANMRTGWAGAVESGRRQDIQSFASGLYRFYEMSSRFQEGEELFKQVAERLRSLHGAGASHAAIDDLLIAQVGASQGGFCYRLGRSEQALQLLQDALVVFRMCDAFESLAFCLTCLGDIARIKGQYPQARTLLEEGLAICEQIGDRSTAARAYTNLGIVSGASGEYREAKQLFQEGLAIFQALGDQWGEAKVLINLGVIAYYLHEYPEAQKLLRASLTIAQAIDNSYDVAVVLNNLGIVAGKQGHYAEAKQLHQESCTISERIGYRLGAGLALNDLGHVARALGEDEASRRYFFQALQTATAIQATPLALDVLVGIALLMLISPIMVTPTQPPNALRVQPALLEYVAQHPTATLPVIVQPIGSSTIAKQAIASLGGQITGDLHMIGAVTARIAAAAVVALGRASGVGWVSLDAPMNLSVCTSCIDTSHLRSALIPTVGAYQVWNSAPKYLQGQGIGVAIVDMSGTSMAAPVVAGAVALLLQDEPTLTPHQVKYRLRATARPFDTPARAGAGYLDVAAAINGTTTQTINNGIGPSKLAWQWAGGDIASWNAVDWSSVSWSSDYWGNP